jgi:hypothetical protein
VNDRNNSSKQYLSVEMESIGGRTVAFQIDEDGELMIAIDGNDAILSVESFQKLREWLGSVPETSRDAEDAAKWRALRNCDRITAMGSAGMDSPDPYAHVTLNFWTGYSGTPGPSWAYEWLDKFVAKAVRNAVKTSCEPPEDPHADQPQEFA